MKFIFPFILFFLAINLGGCVAQSTYKAAQGDSTGYKEIALADNHYRVQFKINGRARSAAQKYAIARAAELTIAQGYDWFVVEKRSIHTLNEPEPFAAPATPTITRRCGLLGCSTSTQLPESTTDTLGLDTPAIETVALIEIRMGRGMRPETESYDAREVWDAQQTSSQNSQ